MPEPVSEAFALAAQLAITTGAAPISKLPGCWELDLSGGWWLALNGHAEDTECTRGPKVLAFHAYVEFNGWPAGLFSPYGGTIAAGEGANEHTLIEALRAKLEEVRGG